jgi:GAF domain-containing protein
MSTDTPLTPAKNVREEALHGLATAAGSNIPGVDFVSITLLDADHTLRTIAATDPLAEQMDALQYELREGPCYAAVTSDRFVLVNRMATAPDYPRYGPRAAQCGVGSQAAIQLIQNGERAGLNLYARGKEAFDHSTLQFAELFATQAAVLLEYAVQVEQLSVALHSRTDIGTAVGIVMERYAIDRNRAFAFLVRQSNHRNVKLRKLALQVIDGTFDHTEPDVSKSQKLP